MESPNLKIVFIKKFREHLDVSMQTAIEYYNRYDADLEKSVEMLKNDFTNKLQKELNIDFEEVKNTLETYKYNYESAYLFLKEKNIQVIDKILINKKSSNEDKSRGIWKVFGNGKRFEDLDSVKNLKEALIFFCHEFGYECWMDNTACYELLLKRTSYLEDKSILDILNTLQDENGKFVPEKYRKQIP
jgi:hypothetical protein